MRGDRRGRVQRDHIPDALRTCRWHACVAHHRPHGIRTAHLESFRPRKSRRETDVVEHRADVEHLEVDIEVLGISEERGKLEAALAMGRNVRIAAVMHQLSGLPGKCGVGRLDQRHLRQP